MTQLWDGIGKPKKKTCRHLKTMIQSGNFIQSGSGQKLQKLSQVDGIDFSNMIREGSALYVQYSFGGDLLPLPAPLNC